MKIKYESDPETIAAISTPVGRGGIGIIRISGPNSLSILSKITQFVSVYPELPLRKRRSLIHTFLIDQKGVILDEIIVGIYPPNKSFTGEMTVEINCHGGRAILAMALQLVLNAGAKMASPGDFTRRAFENKRLDLTHAEGLLQLINARTERGARSARRQIDGGLSLRCKELSHSFKQILSELTAVIDFEMEELPISTDIWMKEIEKISTQIAQMLSQTEKAKFLHQECWLVIAGPPNAGKSSVFNELLNMDRSLVSSQQGTTRDHVSEIIEIAGISVRVTDTAGIRKVDDKLEHAAILRSQDQIEAADIRIFIFDHSQNLSENEIDILNTDFKAHDIVVFNKKDLPRHPSVQVYLDNHNTFIEISTITKYGWDLFINLIGKRIESLLPEIDSPIQINLRQAQLLKKSNDHLNQAIKVLLNGKNFDLVDYELRSAAQKIKEITGEITNDDILNNIFERFCVGK